MYLLQHIVALAFLGAVSCVITIPAAKDQRVINTCKLTVNFTADYVTPTKEKKADKMGQIIYSNAISSTTFHTLQLEISEETGATFAVMSKFDLLHSLWENPELKNLSEWSIQALSVQTMVGEYESLNSSKVPLPGIKAPALVVLNVWYLAPSDASALQKMGFIVNVQAAGESVMGSSITAARVLFKGTQHLRVIVPYANKYKFTCGVAPTIEFTVDGPYATVPVELK